MDAPAADRPPHQPRQVRTLHLQRWKAEGRRWAMLTAYDAMTARVLEEAGIPVLLVGDSAAGVVYGYDTSIPVTMEELLPLVGAVARATHRPLVVADLPFGSFESSDAQAVDSAVRLMKAGANAVKLEGGARRAGRVEAIVTAGIPVMGHIGFTAQAEHAIGGYRVAGRGEAADQVVEDARAIAAAGAFSMVVEMVTLPVARRVQDAVDIPTIGIGSGPDLDAQVLVWQDMAGLNDDRRYRFVKRYADLREQLRGAAEAYAADVESGVFPGPEHAFDA
ncbi:3-methyl-2-oxobutanoate hydroxymethyltransferase [Aquipuribacter nitratireducens]|uniref:3-methyl-2-oxobutanoate hydroxymethyltransferase n=1 Tax=Aquipuribacter nitratireducens TaxID=650104 RepID=A0ABW0GLF7_9MICO